MSIYNFIFSNFPALIIVMPLFMALPVAILPRTENGRWFAWFISFFTSAFIFAACFYLFVVVSMSGSVNYSMGGWSAPFGIQYLVTELNCFILLVLAGTNLLIIPYAQVLMEEQIDKDKIPLFYGSYLLCIAGLLGMVITNDIFNIFVFLEISSLSAYAMISLGRGKEALVAAFNYLILGTIGATFFLLGIAFVYAHTGTLNLSDLSSTIRGSGGNKATTAAITFMTIGLLIKAAVFPFHAWQPRAYAAAPSYVTAFLAATSTKIALFVLLRLMYEIFSAENLAPALLVFAIGGMLFGSIAACMQTNVTRILAFSSVANISYILLGIASFNISGVTASLFHFLAHSLAVAGLFIITGIIAMHAGGTHLKHFHGTAKKMPVTMACFTILGLSLVGIPLTPGFISKWYFINSALQFDNVILSTATIATLVISSALSAVYMWKVVEAIYFKKSDHEFELKYFSSFALITLTTITVFYGLNSTSSIRYLGKIADSLIGGLNG